MKKYVKLFVLILILVLFSACTKIEVKEKLTFEINSEVKYSDLVEKNDKITLINGEELVDTTKLGSKEVIVKYLINKKAKEEKVLITIVDKTPPVIEASEVLTTTQGKEIDMLADVKVTDNSNEEIKAEVVGEYNINKMGDYKLKYSATDSSGNNSTKDFTLSVKNISVKVGGYYMNKKKTEWIGINFKKGNKVDIIYNLCPGSGCGGYSESGTYTLAEKKVIINITSSSSEDGIKKENRKIEFDVINENNIKYKNDTYTWKDKFK